MKRQTLLILSSLLAIYAINRSKSDLTNTDNDDDSVDSGKTDDSTIIVPNPPTSGGLTDTIEKSISIKSGVLYLWSTTNAYWNAALDLVIENKYIDSIILDGATATISVANILAQHSFGLVSGDKGTIIDPSKTATIELKASESSKILWTDSSTRDYIRKQIGADNLFAKDTTYTNGGVVRSLSLTLRDGTVLDLAVPLIINVKQP